MKRFLLPIMLFIAGTTKSQTVIPLYDTTAIPNSISTPDEEKTETGKDGISRVSAVTRPTLTVFLPAPEKANGTAVVICPGGGYTILAISHEGYDVAKRFNEWGVTAFVLKYRLPSDQTMQNKEIGPLQDAQRAIQLVREHAREWHLNKKRIGLMGFSAGGHLASTEGTHFEHSYISNKKHISLRPDFLVLGYPVISFTDSLGHTGSRKNLIGEHPTAEKIAEYSNEMHVTPQTPPTFIVHARDDKTVKVENTLVFAETLKKNHVPVEVYLYDAGGHGFGMHNKTSGVDWMSLVGEWMKKNGWVK